MPRAQHSAWRRWSRRPSSWTCPSALSIKLALKQGRDFVQDYLLSLAVPAGEIMSVIQGGAIVERHSPWPQRPHLHRQANSLMSNLWHFAIIYLKNSDNRPIHQNRAKISPLKR
jgi:hypothetical protein